MTHKRFAGRPLSHDSDGTMARILLAEDDNDMRRFLVKALERAGYEVVDFDNGARSLFSSSEFSTLPEV